MNVIKIKMLEWMILLTKDKDLKRKISIELYKLKNQQAQILINQARYFIEESKKHKKDARQMLKIKI